MHPLSLPFSLFLAPHRLDERQYRACSRPCLRTFAAPRHAQASPAHRLRALDTSSVSRLMHTTTGLVATDRSRLQSTQQWQKLSQWEGCGIYSQRVNVTASRRYAFRIRSAVLDTAHLGRERLHGGSLNIPNTIQGPSTFSDHPHLSRLSHPTGYSTFGADKSRLPTYPAPVHVHLRRDPARG
jgi:hypothetical protein